MRAAAVAVTVAALYGATLGHELVWDDRLNAIAAVDASAAPVLSFSRPLVMASFALDRILWRGAVWGFHLTNLLGHAAVSWLVGTLAAALGAGSGVALAASLLFAVAHGLPSLVVEVAVAGLVLAEIRRRTGSVLPGIGVHMAFNGLALVIAFLTL